MRLALKLTVALVVGIVCVMLLYAWVQVSNEVKLSEADAYYARRRGLAWLGVIESVWAQEGEGRARELITLSMRRAAAAGEVGETIRVVSLVADAPDRPMLSTDEQRALAAGEVIGGIRGDDAGGGWERVYAQIRTAAQPVALELRRPRYETRTFIRMSHLAILGATAAVIAICTLLTGVLQVRLVGRPLARLRDKARRAGAGDFSKPLVLQQRDEMGDLACEINAMCVRLAEASERVARETAARIDALERLRHTDRLATVGQLAAGLAHELGTPLSVISARAELLVAGDAPPRDAAASGRIILEQADRVIGIMQQLLDFSRRRGPKMSLVNIEHVVDRTIDLIRPTAERAHVSVEHAAGGPFFVRLDQSHMEQALANVLMNGIQAMPNGGRLCVAVSARRARPHGDRNASEADYLWITIEDEGTGIPREQLPMVFEPFFTTKSVGKGTGLGLAVAQGIVADHGGWIEVESEVGKGSRFSIVLPRPAEPSAAAS
jgi:signal transduction histidine kinase